MRFSQVLARAARTEYRTPVMKHPYQPGSTFGLLVSSYFKICIDYYFVYQSPATPAYLFAGGCIFATVVELAYQSHQIMEGAVARSSIARRIELGREPDLDSIDHCGGKWYPLNVTRRSRLMERIEFVTAHPMLVLDYFVVWLHHIKPF